MVNTAMLWGVLIATSANVLFVTANELPHGLNTTEERAKIEGCSASRLCIFVGGFCVKSRADCDGTVDHQGCKGKKCKCCIPDQTTPVQSTCPTIQSCPPVPTCPAVQPCSPCPTLEAPTTQVISTTQVPVPAGFELFQGRVIRRTVRSDPRSNYDGCMAYCEKFGAKPFIPRTVADYQLYKEVRTALGIYMWLPANDRLQEGTLRWYNGEVATNISLWEWSQGQVLKSNWEGADCVWYGQGSGPVVYMQPCTHSYAGFKSFPPICEKM